MAATKQDVRTNCLVGWLRIGCRSNRGCESRNEGGKRNEIELFVVRWMDLESVIQSEVSQKEKNKYHMLTHIYGI